MGVRTLTFKESLGAAVLQPQKLSILRWLVKGWLIHPRIQNVPFVVVCVVTAAGVFAVLV